MHVLRQIYSFTFPSHFLNVKSRSFRCPDEVFDKLSKTRENTIDCGGILATRLCTHKENVEQINKTQLQRLPGKASIFESVDSDHNLTKTLDSCCPVKAKLELKIGAQVIAHLVRSLANEVENALYYSHARSRVRS